MSFQPINIDKTKPGKNQESKRRLKEFIGESDFMRMYSNPEKILDMIFIHRFKKTSGICPTPKCGRYIRDYTKVKNKPAYKCGCGVKVYPLKGTPLEQCRTSLPTIMRIIYDIFASKHGLEVVSLLRRKIVQKYQTAQNLNRIISDWMAMCILQQSFQENSNIEMDEVYPVVGTDDQRRKNDRRTQPVFVLLERETGLVKVYPVESANTASARKILEINNLNKRHTIYTDDSRIYGPLKIDYEIHSVNHSKKEYAKNEIVTRLQGMEIKRVEIHNSTNRNENFNRSVKIAVHRVHNGVTKTHLPEYIYQMAFIRSFAQYNANQIVDRMMEALPPLFINGKKRASNNPYVEPLWNWDQRAA